MQVRINDDSVEISGYVNAVGRESRPLRDPQGGYFTETIEPGAFARALMRGHRSMLLNHEESRVLAEEGNGLELFEDGVGLFARATTTDPEVVEKARKRELRGWSFGFTPTSQSEEERNGIPHRTVRELELFEVSIIDQRKMPAYAATSVFTRDVEDGPTNFRAMEFPDIETVENAEQDTRSSDEPDLSGYQEIIQRLERGCSEE